MPGRTVQVVVFVPTTQLAVNRIHLEYLLAFLQDMEKIPKIQDPVAMQQLVVPMAFPVPPNTIMMIIVKWIQSTHRKICFMINHDMKCVK